MLVNQWVDMHAPASKDPWETDTRGSHVVLHIVVIQSMYMSYSIP
jgi:hypothetical protein